MKYTKNNLKKSIKSFGKQTVVVMSLFIAALSLTGCAEEVTQQEQGEETAYLFSNSPLAFVPSVGNLWQGFCEGVPHVDEWGNNGTRGNITRGGITRGGRYEGDDVDGKNYQSLKTTDVFYVSGYRYNPTKGQTVADVTVPNFFNNAQVTYNGQWLANGDYYIPTADDRTDFFAWFIPSSSEGVTLSSSQSGGLQLDYTVPTDPAKHPDLMTAVKRGESYHTARSYTVPLAFDHQLTEVNFVAGENLSPGTVDEIAFTDVCTEGRLTVGNGTWTKITSPSETKYAVNFATRTATGHKRTGETILGGLMMIPQDFTGEEPSVRIKMTVNGTPYTVFAPLKNLGNWQQGTAVTYVVSTSSLPQRLSGVLTLSSNSVKMRVDKQRQVTVTANTSGGALSVVSNNPAIATATIIGNVVTITGKALGTTTVTVTSAETDSYASGAQIINVEVRESIPMETYTVNGVSFKMISVEAGTFSNFASEGYSPTSNLSVVLTNDYYLGETEVTNALWLAVMRHDNPSYSHTSKNNGDNYPVSNVSPSDCYTFLSKLNAITGETFRLPTEAEWEFAARGGNDSEGYRYSGSNTITDVAWYSGNASSTTHPVKQKNPNELGFYDMSGNISEWCNDYYGSLPSNKTVTNPTGASSGSNWVTRGGGWYYNEQFCRTTYRNYQSNISSDSHRKGFRLALSQ